ncbi:MAG TPA: protein YgfX [Casimicrobiaceae bacterium]|nr:protein YgfX [Casimicrobiaceae bacterium]
MKNPPPLRLELKPSRIAAALIAAGVVATASLVASLPAQWWWRAAGSLAIGAYGIWLLRGRAYATAPHSVVAIEIASDLRATFTERSGRRTEGAVQPDSYIGALLTTIVLRPLGARRSRAIAILPDMLMTEDFRRLRVMLRLGRAAE